MGEYYLMGAERRRVSFQLPDTWRVLTAAELKTTGVRKSIPTLVEKAITAPVGSCPLAEMVSGRRRIALLVDDITRPTPRRAILESLLTFLTAQGVPTDSFDVVIGGGTHDPMTAAQIEEEFGAELVRRLRFTAHDSKAPDLVPQGVLPFAGAFSINPVAAGADLKIAVGSILPHPWNGFGGGAKLLFPGISNYDTIRNHHLGLILEKGVNFGNLDGNPFHADVSAAAATAGLDFIINVVYDAGEEVVDIVGGHYEEAYRQGVARCIEEIGVRFSEAADVTITSTFPYNKGPQMMKPVGPATMVTRKGGTVIVYADRIYGGGFPPSMLSAFAKAFSLCAGGDTLATARHYLSRREPIVPETCLEDNHGIFNILLYSSRVKLILVSPEAKAEEAAQLGFGYAPTIEDAIAQVAGEIPSATVNILPAGGLVLPLVAEDMKYEY